MASESKEPPDDGELKMYPTQTEILKWNISDYSNRNVALESLWNT